MLILLINSVYTPALTSGLPAVLAKNARDHVRSTALQQVEAAGHSECIYLAQGGLRGMNGNYSAGVLEGLVHFLPYTLDWLRYGEQTSIEVICQMPTNSSRWRSPA